MIRKTFSAVLLGAFLAAPALATPAQADAANVLHVSKDPSCGCCTAWAELMQEAGFAVTTTDLPESQLARLKAASGVTPEMASCHTATIDGYVVEGHVPAADIKRLLAERPSAIGLTAPGMPIGSPGMGPEATREAYDVLLIGEEGQTEVFTSYAAGTGR